MSLVAVFLFTTKILFWRKRTVAILPHEPNGNYGTECGWNNQIFGDMHSGLAKLRKGFLVGQ